MAKIHITRKDRTCYKCGKIIEKGDSYYLTDRRKYSYHLKCKPYYTCKTPLDFLELIKSCPLFYKEIINMGWGEWSVIQCYRTLKLKSYPIEKFKFKIKGKGGQGVHTIYFHSKDKSLAYQRIREKGYYDYLLY